jgi:hypothetical protein
MLPSTEVLIYAQCLDFALTLLDPISGRYKVNRLGFDFSYIAVEDLPITTSFCLFDPLSWSTN